MSFENIHFVRMTRNIGKLPEGATVPNSRLQPDATTIVSLPIGFAQPITVEIKVKNIGELDALDVVWHGGVILSEMLDPTGEDALFDEMKKTLIATQGDLKHGEMELLTVRRDAPKVDDLNAVTFKRKFPYLVLVGTFHDKFGSRPDAELCGHFESGDELFAYDHSCTRHNH
jgi:hypothetical protein